MSRRRRNLDLDLLHFWGLRMPEGRQNHLSSSTLDVNINSDIYSNRDSCDFFFFENLFFEPVWRGKLFEMKV